MSDRAFLVVVLTIAGLALALPAGPLAWLLAGGVGLGLALSLAIAAHVVRVER
jgi:hypothetical protein